jgi:hypothetical protein
VPDPHVQALRYALKTDASLRFEDPPPLEHETDAFRLLLDQGKLRVEMKEHHPTVASARAAVDRYLRGWELDFQLRHGRRSLWFDFEDSELVDRDPHPAGVVVGVADIQLGAISGTITATSTARGTIHGSMKAYPPPPGRFEISPDVESMRNRYDGFVQGREPLSSMAYFCLTVVEAAGGETRRGRVRREAAARRFAIHLDVLDALGHLTSEKGDRKATSAGPHVADEEKWIDAAVRALIRRLAEHAEDPTDPLPLLTMNDLPPLPPRR